MVIVNWMNGKINCSDFRSFMNHAGMDAGISRRRWTLYLGRLRGPKGGCFRVSVCWRIRILPKMMRNATQKLSELPTKKSPHESLWRSEGVWESCVGIPSLTGESSGDALNQTDPVIKAEYSVQLRPTISISRAASLEFNISSSSDSGISPSTFSKSVNCCFSMSQEGLHLRALSFISAGRADQYY